MTVGPPVAGGQGDALPPELKIEPSLVEARLTLLGVLAAIGLGAAGVALSAGGRWCVALASGLGSFVFACVLIHWRPTRSRLAQLAELVLPREETRE